MGLFYFALSVVKYSTAVSSFMLNHQWLHTGEFKECICYLCGVINRFVKVLNKRVKSVYHDCEKTSYQTNNGYTQENLKNAFVI